jgi:hypothetical protein
MTPWRMGERLTILPPPPSLRLALWAALNASWFHLVDRVGRWSRRAVQAARHVPVLFCPEEPAGSIAALARAGRLSSLMGRLARDRLARTTPFPRLFCPGDDRPTRVEGRR